MFEKANLIFIYSGDYKNGVYYQQVLSNIQEVNIKKQQKKVFFILRS